MTNTFVGKVPLGGHVDFSADLPSRRLVASAISYLEFRTGTMDLVVLCREHYDVPETARLVYVYHDPRRHALVAVFFDEGFEEVPPQEEVPFLSTNLRDKPRKKKRKRSA